MTRSIWTVMALAAVTGVVGSPLFATGCKQTGVGDPCVPEQEYDPQFRGFDEQEVNLESKSFQCQTRLCLVNHFQGRVSCPYGQDVNGEQSATKDTNGKAVGPCAVPGATTRITGPLDSSGNPVDTKAGKKVPPQCTNRTADKAVYCSCRCADLNGKTDNGVYCKCPDGYACTQLVTSIGSVDEGLTGAYCVKDNTQYDRNNGCTECNPTSASGACQ
jgi:hypothetical protein